MEPTLAKPVRMRRRWLIGAALACLALTIWRLWPSAIDPRFVGSWQVGKTSQVYKLGADGTFIHLSYVSPAQWTQWRVRNGIFFDLRSHQGWALFPAWIDRVRKGSTKGDHLYKVVSVTPEALVLRAAKGGELTLNRVSDSFIPPLTKPGLHI